MGPSSSSRKNACRAPLPGSQPRDVPEVALGEPLVPPQGADDPIDEARARVEPRERARRAGGSRRGRRGAVARRAGGGPEVGAIGGHATLAGVRPPAPLGPRSRPMTEAVVEIIGLSKRFGAGVLAVDDLTFSVEHGQVCGLLGPNGAGKTTCLRVLLGLIRPTGGETRLFGERVTPGSDQLRRVGALIESVAFVPHLSGMRNLRLWWEAGGDKWADADVEHGPRDRRSRLRHRPQGEDVLAGDAPTARAGARAARPARGARARRAHQRARPRRDARGAPARAPGAEAGSTVLFSSHVLAEVEQICTHAVVMDKGKLVAAGLGRRAHRCIRLGVPRGRRPRDRASGARGAPRGAQGRRRGARARGHRSTAARRSDLVLALVQAGVAVETVTARRRLEEAFLGLVEAF